MGDFCKNQKFHLHLMGYHKYWTGLFVVAILCPAIYILDSLIKYEVALISGISYWVFNETIKDDSIRRYFCGMEFYLFYFIVWIVIRKMVERKNTTHFTRWLPNYILDSVVFIFDVILAFPFSNLANTRLYHGQLMNFTNTDWSTLNKNGFNDFLIVHTTAHCIQSILDNLIDLINVPKIPTWATSIILPAVGQSISSCARFLLT